MANVVVFGSCVSRDVFSLPNIKFDVSQKYFPRSSIISSVSDPVDINIQELETENQWLKWVIHTDFQKNVFKQIESRDFDLLVIDLIDDRFDLMSVAGSYVTCSDEFIKLNAIKAAGVDMERIDRLSLLAKELYEKAIKVFSKRLLDVCKDKKLVIHRAMYSYQYIDKDGLLQSFIDEKLKRYKRYNDMLSSAYDLLAAQLPFAEILEVEPEFQIGDANHRWGLSPFHYVTEYYKSVESKLTAVLKK